MAQVVFLKIQVDDAQLTELKAGLKDVGGEVQVIEQGAAKVDRGMGKIGKSSIVFRQLNKLTGGLAGNLVDVYNGLKGVNLGLQATKAALIATGIGALVVGLGLVVAYWGEINEFMTGANEKAQEQIDLTKENITGLETQYKILEVREKILEKEGKSTEEIKKQKEDILILQFELNKSLLTQLTTQYELEKSKATEFGYWEKIKAVASAISPIAAKLRMDAKNEDEKQLREKLQGIEEIKLQTELAELALLEFRNPKTKAGKAVDQTPTVGRVDTISGAEADKRAIEAQRKLYEELARTEVDGKQLLQDSANAANQEFLNSELLFQAQRNAAERAAGDARIEYTKLEFEEKQRALFAYGDAAMEVGNLIGEQTALGKGIAVAGALINTYASIAGQLKAFAGVPIPGYAIAQAIATGAFGLATVKNILAVKVPGKGGGGGGSGGVQATPPAFNVVESSPQNQLNNALIAQNETPVQAFVVEGEVSNAEQLRRNKISTSSL